MFVCVVCVCGVCVCVCVCERPCGPRGTGCSWSRVVSRVCCPSGPAADLEMDTALELHRAAADQSDEETQIQPSI